ncbi:MAG TPA: hypothetical protein VEM59_04910 [Acidimicrobiia bacterium]|nr:hypothetical protein [Acidimicrobiia bacterium]
MTTSRRRPRGTYRPPRNRSEVLTAVAAVIGVLVVTAALIWFLQPGDSSPSSPGTPAPVSVPNTPSAPAESAPPAQPGTP